LGDGRALGHGRRLLSRRRALQSEYNWSAQLAVPRDLHQEKHQGQLSLSVPSAIL